MARVWLHTHLPRLESGVPDMISVKCPGERIAYASWVMVRDAEFKVHEQGRRRCVRDHVRNVHAWVVGEEVMRMESSTMPDVWCATPPACVPPGYRKAVYDPFRGPLFVDSESLEPVRSATVVIMSGKNVLYIPAEPEAGPGPSEGV